jgi:hypothetical protein
MKVSYDPRTDILHVILKDEMPRRELRTRAASSMSWRPEGHDTRSVRGFLTGASGFASGLRLAASLCELRRHKSPRQAAPTVFSSFRAAP